jgi:hypothetical protein
MPISSPRLASPTKVGASPILSPASYAEIFASSHSALSGPGDAAVPRSAWSEKGVRLAQNMQVGPCIPVGTQR